GVLERQRFGTDGVRFGGLQTVLQMAHKPAGGVAAARLLEELPEPTVERATFVECQKLAGEWSRQLPARPERGVFEDFADVGQRAVRRIFVLAAEEGEVELMRLALQQPRPEFDRGGTARLLPSL